MQLPSSLSIHHQPSLTTLALLFLGLVAATAYVSIAAVHSETPAVLGTSTQALPLRNLSPVTIVKSTATAGPATPQSAPINGAPTTILTVNGQDVPIAPNTTTTQTIDNANGSQSTVTVTSNHASTGSNHSSSTTTTSYSISSSSSNVSTDYQQESHSP